jgi:HEPN domain-containing protein
MSDWQSEIQSELEKALQARERGNEGQARVCARRAAGIAVREYLSRRGIRPPSTSAYDLLHLIQADPHLPVDLKQIADHLTVRVTKEFKLPVDVDLVAEAGTFCDRLLKSNPQA